MFKYTSVHNRIAIAAPTITTIATTTTTIAAAVADTCTFHYLQINAQSWKWNLKNKRITSPAQQT